VKLNDNVPNVWSSLGWHILFATKVTGLFLKAALLPEAELDRKQGEIALCESQNNQRIVSMQADF